MRDRTVRLIDTARSAAELNPGNVALEAGGALMDVARRSIALAHAAAAMHIAHQARCVADYSPRRVRGIEVVREFSLSISSNSRKVAS